jgi:hypothetical protein
MNEEKSWTELYNKYPSLFVNIHKSPMESCMSFGIECDLGWFEIISSLCHRIKQHEENIDNQAKYKQKKIAESRGLLDKIKNWWHNKKDDSEYSPVKFDQIKEKFGGLRIYHYGGDDYAEGLIDMAEAMSYKICEVCGNKGYPNKDGWIKTTCETHKQNR